MSQCVRGQWRVEWIEEGNDETGWGEGVYFLYFKLLLLLLLLLLLQLLLLSLGLLCLSVICYLGIM